MAAKDVQDLLRLLTTGRKKLPMMAAMGYVKVLQDAGLKSIAEIAGSGLPTLSQALADEKTAKSLLAACKSHVKSPPTASAKRSSASGLSPTSKRLKSSDPLETLSPAALEASLSLPVPSIDEEAILASTIYTNRAPLVLAFAIQLLKHTMPEQPPSSRLSLAQAAVSANSRSKAQSLGIVQGKSAEEQGWGAGQPKVWVMGREISVLKRSGYEWKEEPEEKVEEELKQEENMESSAGTLQAPPSQYPETTDQKPPQPSTTTGWTISTPITSKNSTFIARSITVTSRTEATTALSTLLSTIPSLSSATHHISAYRILTPNDFLTEISNDDGESGGGRHLLGILQSSNLTNVLLVVSRWYGGIFLGPDRWRIMTDVSRDALSQRLQIKGVVCGEALWGLDLENLRSSNTNISNTGSGMPIHQPKTARSYILNSFLTPPSPSSSTKPPKKSKIEEFTEKAANLSLLLGALDMLFKSWDGAISKEELNRRAWGWYVAVRPDVEEGVAGWGGKGVVKLCDILALRRKVIE